MGTTNTFQSMQPDLKDTYSDGKKKRFKRLKGALSSNGKGAGAEEASNNPMKALKNKSYLNIAGKKGVAV